MTKRYYECHVTMLGAPTDIQPAVEALKWKFSAIDGDPTLGDGVKCYATRHYNERIPEAEVLAQLNAVADSLAETFRVIRRKIELVVFDSRIETVSV